MFFPICSLYPLFNDQNFLRAKQASKTRYQSDFLAQACKRCGCPVDLWIPTGFGQYELQTIYLPKTIPLKTSGGPPVTYSKFRGETIPLKDLYLTILCSYQTHFERVAVKYHTNTDDVPEYSYM